jgi:hypothetical protein
VNTKSRCKRLLGVGGMLCLLGGLVGVPPLKAAEFGLGSYLLGLTLPLEGYTPPPGVYFRDAFLLYHGSFGPSTQRTAYNIVADIGLLAWYPEWTFFGASPGFAAVIPYVGVRNKSQSMSIGPGGARQFAESTATANAVGDTEYAAILGWHNGEHHWNMSVTGFMPTGHYHPDSLSITGLNRPAIDIRGAYTYLGVETGIELTGLLGVTVSGMNTATRYQSGTALHFEWLAQQHFPFGLAVGATGFVYQQLTGDSGPGAINGPYIGRAIAIGPSIGYTFNVNGRQLALAGRWYREFAVENRPRGDAVFAQMTLRF